MTKKDYVKIAKAIVTATHEGQICRDCLVHELTEVFEADNPRFDLSTFEKAVQP